MLLNYPTPNIFPNALNPEVLDDGERGPQAMTVVEMARVDGSMSTFMMVHNSLAMLTIGLLGSDAQKAELLPPLARLDWVGAHHRK